MKKYVGIALCVCAMVLSGCATSRYSRNPAIAEDAGLGGMIGAAVGLGAGTLVGMPVEGAVAGLALGAGAGAYHGATHGPEYGPSTGGVTTRRFALTRQLNRDGTVTPLGGQEVITGTKVESGYMNVPYETQWAPNSTAQYVERPQLNRDGTLKGYPVQ